MILHTINKTPWSSDCLDNCLRVIADVDALLLLENGVYTAAASEQLDRLPKGVPVYALYNDLDARGLRHKIDERVQEVSDTEFVDLVVKYPKTQSWY